MASPLSARVRMWAEEAHQGPKTIQIYFSACGGQPGAKRHARAVQMTLAALRHSERRKADMRQFKLREAPLFLTPFEDIHCVVEVLTDRCTVTFLQSKELDDIYVDEGGSGDVRQMVRDAVAGAQPVHTQALVNSAHDLAAIPDDVDPFTGEKLTLDALEAVDSGETQA